MPDPIASARELEAAGFTLIPVHTVGPDGLTCSCPRGRSCRDAGKHPVGTEWQNAPGGASEIEARIEKVKRSNIGIRPGDYREAREGVTYRLLVVDIDPRNGGTETMRTLCRENSPLPATRVVATGGGGWHYYFLVPEGVRLRGSIPSGVDLKMSGMVVAEPSVSAAGEYTLLTPGPIAVAPEWLLAEIGQTSEFTTSDIPTPMTRLDPNDPQLPAKKRYCDAAYRAILARIDECRERQVTEGQRYEGPEWNNTLYSEACNAYELANTPEALLDDAVVTAELFSRMPRDSGFTDADVHKTLASARAKVGDAARDLSAVGGMQFEGTTLRQVAGLDPLDVAAPHQSAWELMRGRTFSDMDVAEVFLEVHDKELIHVDGLGWHRWEGRRFNAVPEDVVVTMAAEMAQDIAAGAARHGTPAELKDAEKRKQYQAAKSCARLAKGTERARTSAQRLDADPHLLNAPNGIVDLRDGTLSAHDPERLMTKMTRAEFRLDATHPDVEQALSAMRPDALDWMQLRFGQALIGETPTDDKLTILHGGGSNGKSALMDAIMFAIGPYGVAASERMLIVADGAHSTELTDVRGARVAFLEELPGGGQLSAKRIKNLAGTDVMTARKVYQDSITWRATHTVFVTTNHHPKVVETDHGTWRRLVLVDFPYRYIASEEGVAEDGLEDENDRMGDVDLRSRLKEPRQQEAILAWAARGAVRYYALGKKMPPPPPSVESDTRLWRASADPLSRFLEDNVEVTAEKECIPSEVLYQVFGDWLLEQGHTRWSANLLAERLRSSELLRGTAVEKVRTRFAATGSDSASWAPSYPNGWIGRAYGEGQQAVAWRGLRWKALDTPRYRGGLRAVADDESS